MLQWHCYIQYMLQKGAVMQLFELWKDSLAVCAPTRFMALMRETFASMKEVARVFCALWFWIPLILIVGSSTYWAGIKGFIVSVNVMVIVFSPVYLIAARPVNEVKDFLYIKHCVKHVFWFAFISVLIELVLVFPFFRPITVIVAFIFSLLPALFDISILFYLDDSESGTSRATRRAIYMIFYNYPLFFLIINGTKLLSRLTGFLLEQLFIAINLLSFPQAVAIFILGGTFFVFYLFFTVFIKCLTVRLYTDRLQAQPTLYQ